MKQIRIKEIHLRNFKGAKDVNINFDPILPTNITGDNGTGKTTIFDAFNFVLWGKNSNNETSFNIKTLDSNGKTQDVEHEVMAILSVDEEEITLRRVYTEKWVKKRGFEIPEFSGNETSFFVNDVPKSLSEYKSIIDGIIHPSFARMITDPMYFNTQMDWKQRRELLTAIAGIQSDESLINELSTPANDLSEIISILNSGKSLADKKAEIAAKKSKLKIEINEIGPRLDEVDRNKPAAQDWVKIETDKEKVVQQLSTKKQSLTDLQQYQQQEFEKVRDIQTKKNNLQSQIDQEKIRIESESNSERNSLISTKNSQDEAIRTSKNAISLLESDIAGNDAQISVLRGEVDKLREDWKALNAKPIETSETIKTTCPSCLKELDPEKIESQKQEIAERANASRKAALDDLMEKATKKNGEIQFIQANNSGLNARINQYKENLASYKEITIPDEIQFVASEKLIQLQSDFDLIIVPEPKSVDVSEINSEIERLNESVREFDTILLDKQRIIDADQRISELKSLQQTLSQELANLEKIEISIDNFTKAKMNLVESRVNNLFNLVKFKMFETQINGGESPTCICLIDGVPFGDLNKAKTINAGLDIINTLQNYFQTFAPVFIDNRESVSSIQPMSCQVINLIKVEEEKTLKVN